MFTQNFLGRGWKYPLSFTKAGVLMSEAEDDIDESLRILLTTYPGERIMHPDFGCRLRDYCFRNYDGEFVALIVDEIQRAILFHESRINVENIVVARPDENGVVKIKIEYTVRLTNTRRNMVFPFYLNEGTDINL